jgi:hypothetical protein
LTSETDIDWSEYDSDIHVGPDGFEGSSVTFGDMTFDDTDLFLISILKDTVLAPEFCWSNPNNVEYGGTYRVRDYQVKFNRVSDHYAGFSCARSVGKTEREMIFAFTHAFRRSGENLLITAPELLHLHPLTKAIEDRIERCRLTRECLRKDKPGMTGFSHNPFGVEYSDGTKIVGRIPNRDGRGVKGQHQRDLIIEEAQDYPDAGWTEVHETVMKEGDFRYHFYGVHRGARGGGFAKRVQGGMFNIHTLTAIQRPGWGPEEKRAAIDTYGGVNSPDYRRNILGEPGAASSPIFVVARLMACVDQNPDSEYNTKTYVQQHFRWEDFAQSGLELAHALDLPSVLATKKILVGMDLGLTNSPTVCSIFAEIKHRGKGESAARPRLALIRRFTLQHFKSKDIRHLAYLIWRWRKDIAGTGMDTTGLGFPIFQEIEDDESYPDEFKRSVHGWKFNEKIEITSDDNRGHEEVQEGMPFYFKSQDEQKTTSMTVIEATTNYLREWVDSNYLLLPMDNEVVEDLLAENIQRVQDVSRLTGSKKPNRFHILDSFRMASLIERLSESEHVAEMMSGPVLDRVIDPGMM